jgi:hypothetical protein
VRRPPRMANQFLKVSYEVDQQAHVRRIRFARKYGAPQTRSAPSPRALVFCKRFQWHQRSVLSLRVKNQPCPWVRHGPRRGHVYVLGLPPVHRTLPGIPRSQ